VDTQRVFRNTVANGFFGATSVLDLKSPFCDRFEQSLLWKLFRTYLEASSTEIQTHSLQSPNRIASNLEFLVGRSFEKTSFKDFSKDQPRT
jgi:hypothetical protein